jgi:hypothetical protein
MNTNKLLIALDDERNEHLLDFNSFKIKEITLKILKELQLSKQTTMNIYKKLINYRYVDDTKKLKPGTYIRWIPIDKPTNIELSKKAVIFCEVITNEKGSFCVCKNFGYNSYHFQIDVCCNLLFQKLTEQEQVLLSALDHLSRNI